MSSAQQNPPKSSFPPKIMWESVRGTPSHHAGSHVNHRPVTRKRRSASANRRWRGAALCQDRAPGRGKGVASRGSGCQPAGPPPASGAVTLRPTQKAPPRRSPFHPPGPHPALRPRLPLGPRPSEVTPPLRSRHSKATPPEVTPPVSPVGQRFLRLFQPITDPPPS